MGTKAFGGGDGNVWEYFSVNCQLDLHVLLGSPNSGANRDNVFIAQVVPPFDNHSLADRPIFKDNNTRSHRAHIMGRN